MCRPSSFRLCHDHCGSDLLLSYPCPLQNHAPSATYVVNKQDGDVRADEKVVLETLIKFVYFNLRRPIRYI